MSTQGSLFIAGPGPDGIDRPALGILELASIARGVVVVDAALKQAPSLVLMSRPVSSGKHLVMLRGQVAEIDESMRAARAAAAGALVDVLELAYAHEQLWPLLAEPVSTLSWDTGGSELSVAIVETQSVCAAVAGADVAAKTAPVVLRDMRLAVGIGGKAFFSLTGELADVQAAAEAAAERAGGQLLALEIIPAPAAEIYGRLFF